MWGRFGCTGLPIPDGCAGSVNITGSSPGTLCSSIMHVANSMLGMYTNCFRWPDQSQSLTTKVLTYPAYQRHEQVMCLQGELDELEREEFFRLKKVQAKKKRDAADKDQAVLQVCCKLFAAACSRLWVNLDCHSHSLL